MKRLCQILAGILLGQVVAISAIGQDTFQNLDFESAQVIIATNIGPNQFITAANALPGWSPWSAIPGTNFFSGMNQLSLIEYNGGFLNSFVRGGTTPVDLFGSNPSVISGNFSVLVSAYGSISQTALVPANALSLRFDATSPSLVSLDGQSLSLIAIALGTNSSGGYRSTYTVYAADISAFAGQVETLTFSGGGILDDIQFSSSPIPESSPSWLLFLGSGIFMFLRTRIRSLQSN